MAASVVPIIALVDVYPLLLLALMGSLYTLIINPLYYRWTRRWAIIGCGAIFVIVAAIGCLQGVKYILIWAVSWAIYVLSEALKASLGCPMGD